jgi:hypothetical protein
MERKIKLGILDQSIVRQGNTAAEAIEETIATAKLAKNWATPGFGYPSITMLHLLRGRSLNY